MASARAFAGRTAFGELIAGVGTPLVNAARDFLTNGARERGAAWARVVCATHTPSVLCDLHTQTIWHTSALTQQIEA